MEKVEEEDGDVSIIVSRLKRSISSELDPTDAGSSGGVK